MLITQHVYYKSKPEPAFSLSADDTRHQKVIFATQNPLDFGLYEVRN